MELKIGEYTIPDGCTIKRVGNIVKVYAKKQVDTSILRCRDCKHFTEGYTTYHEFTTTICDLKPKILSESTRRSIAGMRFKDRQLYYHVTKYSKVCNNFELKNA